MNIYSNIYMYVVVYSCRHAGISDIIILHKFYTLRR